MAAASHLEARELTPQFGAELVGLEPKQPLDSETGEFFRHLFDRRGRQHARPTVLNDGPPRTLRKVAFPLPKLNRDELPSCSRVE